MTEENTEVVETTEETEVVEEAKTKGKNFIVIENDGTFPHEYAIMWGAGKPDSIGFAGSGLKFAMVAALRLNLDILIQSGDWKLWPVLREVDALTKSGRSNQEVVLYFRHRGVGSRRVIPMNCTLDFGVNWTDPWHPFRELIANAINKPGFQYRHRSIEDVRRVGFNKGKTFVYIEANEQISSIVQSMKMFIRMDEEGNIPSEMAFPERIGAKPFLYRQGIFVCEVADNGETYDYEMPDLRLTEDRMPYAAPNMDIFFDPPATFTVKVIQTMDDHVQLVIPRELITNQESLPGVDIHILPDRAFVYIDNEAGVKSMVIELGEFKNVHSYRNQVPVMITVDDEEELHPAVDVMGLLAPGEYRAMEIT